MITWLDWYVSGAMERFGEENILPGGSPTTDADAMHYICLSHMTMFARRKDSLSKEEAAEFSFFSSLMSFCNPGLPSGLPAMNPVFKKSAILFKGRGLALDRKTVMTFAGANVPKSEWLKEALDCCWYLDIPHGAMMLDADRQVRAIFTQPNPNVKTISFVCVVTAKNDNKPIGKFSWMLGAEDGVYGPSGIADKDFINKSITDFTALSMLYFRTNIDSCKRMETLPQVERHHASLPRKKQKAAQKKKSLFTIVKLVSPVNSFGRDLTGTGASWNLKDRITVRGHFKMQPYGAGRNKRRLIWVDEYEKGPSGGRVKPVLFDE